MNAFSLIWRCSASSVNDALFRAHRTAEIQAVELRAVRRPRGLCEQRIARIQVVVVELREGLAAQQSLPGLVKISMRAKPGRSYSGENGLAVDADLADGGLRRQTAAGEAIDVELAAAGSGSRTGQRLQLQREFVGIVGERRELPFAQHHAAAVGLGLRADAAAVRLPR